MYGGFKIGFNQKKEEESDVKKVKVGLKKEERKEKKGERRKKRIKKLNIYIIHVYV